MSSELTKPLGEWVKQLFNDAFFYDNDDIAFKAMEERLSPDIKVRYQILQIFSLAFIEHYSNFVVLCCP